MPEQLLEIHLVFLPQIGVFQKHIGLHSKLDMVKKKLSLLTCIPELPQMELT